MASSQQFMFMCSKCEKSTMHIRTIPNTLLHIFLMFCTAGLWFIIWLLFVWKGPPKCTTCGAKNTTSSNLDKKMSDGLDGWEKKFNKWGSDGSDGLDGLDGLEKKMSEWGKDNFFTRFSKKMQEATKKKQEENKKKKDEKK